jgi:hypothetical protein
MARKSTTKNTKTDDAPIPESGGLTVAEVGNPDDNPAQDTELAELAITDDQDAQATVADPPEAKPKRGRKARKTAPTLATGRVRGGQKAESTKTPTSKKKTHTKDRKADTAPKRKAIKPDANLTMAEAVEGYLKSLEANGRSRGCVFSYSIECAMAMKHFGPETPVATFTTRKIKEFFESPKVTTRRNGDPKNQLSIDKTRRVVRQLLLWLAEVGVYDEAPIPDLKAKTEVKTSRKPRTKK